MVIAECETLIIGAGASGCVIAARLVERSDARVTVVEAGPDYGSFAEGLWPAEILDYRTIPTSHDWDLWNEPRSGGDRFPLPCARVVGGSSSHNACGINWGSVSDYEEWTALGNPGWGAAEMLSYLQRVEADREASGPWHGRTGPVPVTRFSEDGLVPFFAGVADGARALGVRWLDDVNDPNAAVGIGRTAWNVMKGVRWNAALAYLDPVRGRPNLRVLADSKVDRVLMRGTRAYGAAVLTPEGPLEIHADRVVISAGAYGSPATLLRSGIGAAQHLRELGVAVVNDLPGVGQHLQDHPVTPLRFYATAAGMRSARALAAQGIPPRSQVEIRARSEGARHPCDLHFTFSTGSAVQDGWEFLIRVEVFKPSSSGSVRLRSADPGEAPIVDSRYFSDPEGRDLAAMRDGVRFVRELMSTPAVAEHVARERWPTERVTKEELDAFAAANAYTYHHPCGTCKMGPSRDALAVVDARGRVHGIEGLYVGDASIMPTIPAAMPNLTCMAIGERLADLLLRGD